MHRTSTYKLAAAVAAVAAMAIPAGALADAAPAAPHCTYSVKKKQSLAAVKRHGISVSVTCDGPTEVSSILLLTGRPDRDWDDKYINVQNPPVSQPHATPVTAGQPATTRVTLTKNAAKFLSHYKRPRVMVLLGVKHPGKRFYDSVDSGKPVVLI